MKIGYVDFMNFKVKNSLKYIVQLKNMEFVQIPTCTKSQLVHNIYISNKVIEGPLMKV